MNRLPRMQRPAKDTLHHAAMLSDIPVCAGAVVEVALFHAACPTLALDATARAGCAISIDAMAVHLAIWSCTYLMRAAIHYAALLTTRLAPDADPILGRVVSLPAPLARSKLGVRTAPFTAKHLAFPALSRREGIFTTKALSR